MTRRSAHSEMGTSEQAPETTRHVDIIGHFLATVRPLASRSVELPHLVSTL